MEQHVKEVNKYFSLYRFCCIGLLFLFLTYYSIFYDLIIIFSLLISSYCTGSFFLKKNKTIDRMIFTLSIGLGLSGLMIYFLLLVGIGQNSFYIAILTVPIIIQRKKVKQLCFNIKILYNRQIRKHSLFWIMILFFFLMYCIVSASPIIDADTMAKHLPISLYAAKNGSFNFNIMESLTYGEPMLLNHTFTTLFISFNAYKSLKLFNTILLFLILFILIKTVHTVLKNTNIYFFSVIFLSTPLFYVLIRNYGIEVLPIYFVLSSVLACVKISPKQAWNNLYIIAFCFGCALFSKLTSAYSILIVGTLVIVLCFMYLLKCKIKFIQIIKRFFVAFIIFIFPFSTSVFVIYWKTGNPLFPFYNSIFKSPYFQNIDFIDPFQNQLNLSFKSLYNIIFQTELNMELHSGGLGFFLLLVLLIPFALWLHFKKKFIIWSIISFAIYVASTCFTWNIRYYSSIFMMMLLIVTIALTILLGKTPINIQKGLLAFLIIVLAVPNIIYIHKYYPIEYSPDKRVTVPANHEVMDEVPRSKKVLSFNDPYKADYDGYYSSFTWYSMYFLMLISNEEISIEDYIQSFDYVLYQKGSPITDNRILEIVQFPEQNHLILEKESSNYLLYRVEKIYKIIEIQSETFEPPLPSRTTVPVSFPIQEKKENYIITQDVENAGSKPISMRFLINWCDAHGEVIKMDYYIYNLNPGRQKDVSKAFTSPVGTDHAFLYVMTDDDQEVLVHGYDLKGYDTKSIVDIEYEKYQTRQLL